MYFTLTDGITVGSLQGRFAVVPAAENKVLTTMLLLKTVYLRPFYFIQLQKSSKSKLFQQAAMSGDEEAIEALLSKGIGKLFSRCNFIY